MASATLLIPLCHHELDALALWYLVCEYANGGSLADYLEAHNHLSEELAIKIALDISNALTEVWKRGIVHRDIKPSNILLARNANGEITAKLGDFGAAQDQQTSRTTLLQGSSHPGTPLYMAPEQANSANMIDVRADIYALGITLWEMLTNQDYKLLAQNGEPDLRQYNSAASTKLATVIKAAVQKDVQQRYQTPADMIQDLEAVQHRKDPKIAMRKQTSTPKESYGARKWLLGLLGLIILGLIGGGTYMAGLWNQIPPLVALVSTATSTATAVPPTAIPPTATIEPTPEPPTITMTPANICQVPNVAGEDQSAAEALLAGAGLQAVRSPQFNATVPAGMVISQTPKANTRLDPCQGEVTIIVSTGPEPTVTVLPTEQPTSVPELTKTPTSTAVVSPTGSFPVFRDDFDTTLRPEWRVASSGLSIRQGSLVGDRGVIVYDQKGNNYIIRIRVKGDGTFGVMFRRTPNLNEGYMFKCDYNQCRWYVRIDGNDSQAISSSVSRGVVFDSDEFHNLTLEIKGRNFTALVDDAHFSSVTDETYTSGVVGVFSDRGYDHQVAFDYFELAPLP